LTIGQNPKEKIKLGKKLSKILSPSLAQDYILPKTPRISAFLTEFSQNY